MYRKFLKRVLDVFISAAAALALSPVYFLTAVLVRLKLGSPVIFKQERVGKEGKVFTIFKYRTMTDARDNDGKLLPDTERLTRFGKFLRASSLDELPELINIIKGDMSLVGPRPLLTQYLPLYSKEQARRHEVRPGLTGLAQINGRNATTWKARFEFDIHYVDNYSFWLDMSIIAKTFFKVLKRKSAENEALMPYFTGNEE